LGRLLAKRVSPAVIMKNRIVQNGVFGENYPAASLFIVKFDSDTISPYNEECSNQVRRSFLQETSSFRLKMNSDGTSIKPREKIINAD
jgi:hypothetical protein